MKKLLFDKNDHSIKLILAKNISMNFNKEINRRRTFGIISHPDAGKTTLTEKLLLYGGAIQEAGAVKSNKIKKGATSDFMEIERQRGISVATSVLAFEYEGIKINILDTPGHKDFAEDTYRTLTAVDSVIVVIDVAKGVEEQTEKLVEVCKMRKIPIIVFINKLDREGKDAFDLLDEIELKLKLKVCPLSFPIGMGYDFSGIYNIYDDKVSLLKGNEIKVIDKNEIKNSISNDLSDQFIENLELLEMVYPKFDKNEYLRSNIQPVFFGSALNNFGVEDLLRCFIIIAPIPQPRDRLAFIKIVSGEFKRNTPYLHVRLSKKLKFSSPNAFFADKKEIVDTSYPGDIVGLHDTGNFKIGDTLTSGENLIYEGIPSFSPEHFRYINNADPMKSKQLSKGINQLMDEGVAQLFTLDLNGRKVIGTVGALQYEVIQYRLQHEYGAKCSYENLNVFKACWVECENKKGDEFIEFKRIKQRYLAKDKNGNLVFLADSVFSLNMTIEKYPSIKFHNTSEF
jgi:peptide chain release factor 3